MTAPTSGFGVVRPRPPSASSIARARWTASVCRSVLTTSLEHIDCPVNNHSTQAPYLDLGPGSCVAERIAVVGGVEREIADGTAAAERADPVEQLAALLERAGARDRLPRRLRIGERAAPLDRARGSHAVLATRIPVEHRRTQRA